MSDIEEARLECQLAQAQLKRYLAGDALPEEMVAELTEHLSGCADCKAAADRQRAELEGLLGLKSDVAAEPVESGQPKGRLGPIAKLRAFLIALAERRKEATEQVEPEQEPDSAIAEAEPAPEKRPGLPAKALAMLKEHKTVALSCALGAVLVAMTHLSQNPTGLLGPKAKTTSEAQANEESHKEPTSDTEADRAESEEEPADKTLIVAKSDEPEPIEAPAPQPEPKPKPTTQINRPRTSRPTPKPTPKPAEPAPAPKVTVYDPEGNPLNTGK